MIIICKVCYFCLLTVISLSDLVSWLYSLNQSISARVDVAGRINRDCIANELIARWIISLFNPLTSSD